MLDKWACSTSASSAFFADLVGGISGELLLLDLSPRFPQLISGVPSLLSGFSAITLNCGELKWQTTQNCRRPF